MTTPPTFLEKDPTPPSEEDLAIHNLLLHYGFPGLSFVEDQQSMEDVALAQIDEPSPRIGKLPLALIGSTIAGLVSGAFYMVTSEENDYYAAKDAAITAIVNEVHQDGFIAPQPEDVHILSYSEKVDSDNYPADVKDSATVDLKVTPNCVLQDVYIEYGDFEKQPITDVHDYKYFNGNTVIVFENLQDLTKAVGPVETVCTTLAHN